MGLDSPAPARDLFSYLSPAKRRIHTRTALAVVALATVVGCSRSAAEAPPGAGAGITAAKDASAATDPPLPAASVQAIVNPEKLPAYEGPRGSIEGTVFVTGPESPEIAGQDFKTCPAGLDTYGKLFRAGPAREDGLRPLADAVVVVTGYRGFYLPEKSDVARVTITANCAYPQRTIVMTFGQRLEIANDSRAPFAPMLSGLYQPAIMIAPPGQNGEPVKLTPERPGHYVLGDEMQAFVRESLLVLPQPLHAVSDLRGHFRIDGVPVGRVKVGAQLDAIGNAIHPTDVDVRPNVVENVELVLPYAPPDAGAPTPRHRLIP